MEFVFIEFRFILVNISCFSFSFQFYFRFVDVDQLTNMLSDSDSSDSDNGFRFKYHSVRAKEDGDASFSSRNDPPRDDRRTSDRHHRHSDNRLRRSVSRERRKERDGSKSKERQSERRRSRSRDRQLDRKPSNERARDNNKSNNKFETNRNNIRNRSRSRDRNDRLNESRGSNESRKRNNRSRSRDRRSDNRHEGSRSRNSSRNREMRKRSRSNELRGHGREEPVRNVRRPPSIEKVENESKERKNVLENASNSHSRADGKSRYSRKNSPNDIEDSGSIGDKRRQNAIDLKREIKADKLDDRKSDRNSDKKMEKSKNKSNPQSTHGDDDMPSISSRGSSATADRLEASRNTDILSQDDSFDPSVCGPALPPHMLPTTSDQPEIIGPVRTQSSPSIGCPAITSPPQRSRSPENKKHRILGPILPSNIDLEAAASSLPQNDAVSDISDTEDIDFDLVGPLPPGLSKSDAHLELERRALELKLAQLNDSDEDDGNEPVRDEWMTALPAVRKVTNMGLVARQFKAKAGPEIGDRTGWTDTPGDRERKAQRVGPTPEEVIAERQREAEAVFRSKRDAEQEKAASKHKKKHKRDQSLLDLHQKKLKKKQKVNAVCMFCYRII